MEAQSGSKQDTFYLKEAIKQAEKAYLQDEVPVGAIIVLNNKIIARSYNQKESKKDPTNHAELIAIKKACAKIKDWRLNDCLLYTSLEPCPMCAGAILQSRIKKVIYAAKDFRWGAIESQVPLLSHSEFNHETETKYIPLERAQSLLKTFFKEKRAKK